MPTAASSPASAFCCVSTVLRVFERTLLRPQDQEAEEVEEAMEEVVPEARLAKGTQLEVRHCLCLVFR